MTARKPDVLMLYMDAVEATVTRLEGLLQRCLPAVRDAEYLSREVMCQEGVEMYRTLLNDIEEELG